MRGRLNDKGFRNFDSNRVSLNQVSAAAGIQFIRLELEEPAIVVESRRKELKDPELAQQGVIARPEPNGGPPAKGLTVVGNFEFRVAGMNDDWRSVDTSNAARSLVVDCDT
jgi:hypothetical protein